MFDRKLDADRQKMKIYLAYEIPNKNSSKTAKGTVYLR